MGKHKIEQRGSSRYDCVEVNKYNTMRAICGWSGIACLVMSVLTLAVGIALPFLVEHVIPAVVWTSMALEALSFVLYYTYSWIAKQTK